MVALLGPHNAGAKERVICDCWLRGGSDVDGGRFGVGMKNERKTRSETKVDCVEQAAARLPQAAPKTVPWTMQAEQPVVP